MKNKNVYRIATLLSTFLLISTVILSQVKEESLEPRSQFRDAINACPGGLIFGIAAINYEHLFENKIGLVARVDYEGVPKSYTDANIESQGYALILQSRYHFTGEMKSLFANVFVRGRMYDGSGTLEGTDFDFSRPDLTVGLSAGKRWVWNSGFNMLAQVGYGVQWTSRDVNNSSPAIESSIDEFEDTYDFMDPILGEFSIGYAF